MKKISIIGAGHVGGATAMRIAESGLARVVLIDVVENVAKAKAYDLEDARYCIKTDSRIEGSSDMEEISNSDIVIVTAGFSRKPGMTREDLLFKNSQVLSNISQGIVRYAKDAIVIVVTNPLDVMTYVTLKATGFNRFKVFGMGSNLDSSRFASLISKKLFVGVEHIEALVIAAHGEGMLPLPRLAKVRGKALTELMDANDIASLVEKTKQRGAEIVSLYDTGNAFYGPSAALFEIAETILSGHPREIPVSVLLEGEYGQRDVCLGVPALIGSGGIEKIAELDLDLEENEAFQRCAQSVKESIKVLKL